ncbi:MAG: prolyl-tRNA synthetase associated domain-containing protein [Paludibacteraceae bacterium]|nr:prolyl-tRNA synthetase associated domain-containing protein [Paludibacteraceae bacterium]
MEIFDGQPNNLTNRSEAEVNVYSLLHNLGIQYQTLGHEAAHAMEQCAEVEKVLGAPICKNLFLCNRQQTQFYLVMLPGDKVFKTKQITSQLGCARLSFAGEEHMVNLLHIHPGAVSPMGLMNDTEKKVMLVIDKDLFNNDIFGCHPCVNTASLKLSLKELVEIFLPAVGHEHRVVELVNEVE